MRSPRRDVVSAVAVATALAVGAACSNGDDDASTTAAPTDPPDVTEPAVTAEPDRTDDVDTTDPTPATADTTTTTVGVATTTTIGTVPDTGVPGIDSTDAFCRSWSEFAGSFQALALASAFNPGVTAAESEVAASGALVAAVGGLDDHLPEELEGERTALVTDLAGPMTRRAARAVEILEAAGFTDDEIAALATAWLDTLAVVGVDDPEIRVALPDGIDAGAFAAAAEGFAAELPPINQDPSLITDAQIPSTERYLADNCPDQGTLAGNDVIDQV